MRRRTGKQKAIRDARVSGSARRESKSRGGKAADVPDAVAQAAAEETCRSLADITAQRTAEQALRESEKNFRTVADNANEAILIALPEGRHTYANDFACRMTGYSPDELLRMTTADLLLPADRDRVARYSRNRLARRSVPKRYETVMIAKNGRQFRVEITGSTTVWEGTRCTLGMVRDIEERKQAEETLRASETMMASAQRIANMGSWFRDLGTGSVAMSDQLFRIFGIDPATYDGRVETVLESVHPEDRQKMREIAASKGDPSLLYAMEYRVRWPDGTVRMVQASGDVVRDGRGQPIGTLGVVQDVTERRMMERQLLEISNQEKRDIGQILHDSLGQHLTGVAFCVKALERSLAARGLPQAEEAGRIVSLISQAIAQTRSIAHGMSPVDMATEGLAAALRRMARGTRELYRVSCRCRGRRENS
jgi:PAS domain S-box-containing protein